MDQTTSGPGAMFFLGLYLPVTLFALGLLVGWLLGKARRVQALAALLVGGGAVFAGYTGLFLWLDVFDVKVEVQRPTTTR